MDTYKYSEKGGYSSQTTSEQAGNTAAIGKSSRQNSAFRHTNTGTSDRGMNGEKRLVFNNKISAANDSNNNGASGFKTGGTHARFSSWTSEQRGAHAFTRDINSHAPRYLHISDNDPRTVQTMRDDTLATKTDSNGSSADKTDASDSRPVSGVKFKEITSAVIQRERLTDKVTDVALTSQSPSPDPKPLSLAPNPKPTIVFETMTQRSGDALSIFSQTLNYSGNTICIVGFNQQVKDLDPAAKDQMSKMNFGVADTEVIGENKAVHILRCFKFNWKKPSRVDANAQYKMPFVEARLEVMRQAKNFTEAIQSSVKREAADLSYSFIYRWIDGDAGDDTSEEIPYNTLQRLSTGELWAVSGIYGWRSGVDSAKYPAYTALIHEINCFEELVRRIYFRFKRSLEGVSNAGQQLPDFLPGGNVNGYYFPETTLMLGEKAHDSIMSSVSGEIPEAKEEPQFLHGAEQSKESMRMLEIAKMPRSGGLIVHSDALRVTKPLKNEFNTATAGTPCYLGEDFLNALVAETPMTREKFEQHLRQMRQSVLDMFNVAENRRAFKEKVEELLDGLYSYYSENSAKIRDELRSIPGVRQSAAQRGRRKK